MAKTTKSDVSKYVLTAGDVSLVVAEILGRKSAEFNQAQSTARSKLRCMLKALRTDDNDDEIETLANKFIGKAM